MSVDLAKLTKKELRDFVASLRRELKTKDEGTEKLRKLLQMKDGDIARLLQENGGMARDLVLLREDLAESRSETDGVLKAVRVLGEVASKPSVRLHEAPLFPTSIESPVDECSPHQS